MSRPRRIEYEGELYIRLILPQNAPIYNSSFNPNARFFLHPVTLLL